MLRHILYVYLWNVLIIVGGPLKVICYLFLLAIKWFMYELEFYIEIGRANLGIYYVCAEKERASHKESDGMIVVRVTEELIPSFPKR